MVKAKRVKDNVNHPEDEAAIAPAQAVAAVEADTPADEPQADNKYGVPNKMWNKWTDAQRAMFTYLFRYMFDNQGLFKHPKAPVLESAQWKTVAWNAAWMAADFVKE